MVRSQIVRCCDARVLVYLAPTLAAMIDHTFDKAINIYITRGMREGMRHIYIYATFDQSKYLMFCVCARVCATAPADVFEHFQNHRFDTKRKKWTRGFGNWPYVRRGSLGWGAAVKMTKLEYALPSIWQGFYAFCNVTSCFRKASTSTDKFVIGLLAFTTCLMNSVNHMTLWPRSVDDGP
jgi:hypothetical protein